MKPEQYRAGESGDAIRARLDGIMAELTTALTDAEVANWLTTEAGQQWITNNAPVITENDPRWLAELDDLAADWERKAGREYTLEAWEAA